MSGHPLDRPVWSCLTGAQAHLARGDGAAWRIDPAYGPFAAARDAGAEAQAALAALVRGADDAVAIVEPAAWPVPPGLRLEQSGELLQMVAERPSLGSCDDPRVEPLGESDAAEMSVLAHTTEPGPWAHHTHRFGDFVGIRIAGRLVAMAGERMRPCGYTEVSGVCTHPDFRGQGMAAALIRQVMRGMVARGEAPFLHSYAHNSGAIRIYQTLGFRARRTMALTVLARG